MSRRENDLPNPASLLRIDHPRLRLGRRCHLEVDPLAGAGVLADSVDVEQRARVVKELQGRFPQLGLSNKRVPAALGFAFSAAV